MQKQRPAQYQGLYLVAPDGKVFASHQNFKSDKTWPQEVLADLHPGLKAFGDVKHRAIAPADPLPERGVGLRADDVDKGWGPQLQAAPIVRNNGIGELASGG